MQLASVYIQKKFSVNDIQLYLIHYGVFAGSIFPNLRQDLLSIITDIVIDLRYWLLIYQPKETDYKL